MFPLGGDNPQIRPPNCLIGSGAYEGNAQESTYQQLVLAFLSREHDIDNILFDKIVPALSVQEIEDRDLIQR